MKHFLEFVVACCALVSLASAEEANTTFSLAKGDHICIIGNTLPERMQHDGWLETLLHARFPGHELVIRNLGYSGDELDPAKRIRSRDFGTPDEWLSGNSGIPQPNKLPTQENTRTNRFELTNTKADVVFAFFGYNESWAGDEGLDDFRSQLDKQLRHLLGQKYNGKSAPRVVLFSPTAFENLRDPNLPDGKEHNVRIAKYTGAMGEVAAANGVRFVNLFAPTSDLFRDNKSPFTINGVHLSESGNKAVAEIIDVALFGAPREETADKIAKIRTAVQDKNWHWFNRYRVTDGYSTYGDRAFLEFADRQTNYEVGQRELEVLDVMTANRDRVCWAVAQGKVAKPDDSNLPPLLEVKTNKPGNLPDGKHEFLGGEAAIKRMTAGKGLKVNLFASEEQFPELINPVQMAWDTKGRLWVATWPTYPHWKPTTEEMNDKLLILEDTNGDGRADKCITFADKLHNPTGFEFYGGGVIVAMAPDILFIKDVDGDDHVDVRERILHGLDTADTHHTANSFVLDPGGALYFQEGTFHHSQIESAWGPTQRLANAGIFRFEPRSQKFDIYVTYGFANPHGHVFDAWGQDFVTDGTNANTYWGTAFSGYRPFPQKHRRMHNVYEQRTRPCPATEILSSRHFPNDWQGNLIVPNVIGFQGLLRYKFEDAGSGFTAFEQEPIVFSDDANFRPADVEVAPDGSLYFTDWQNPIIGHLQHNLRDPNRDKTHGRVYRVTYEGSDLLKPLPIAGEPLPALLEALKQPENRVRYRAKIELSGRKTKDVIPALESWIASLDKNDPNFEHDRLEGLWVYQYHNLVNAPLLEQVLASPDFRARAAAARVLLCWRDRVSGALEHFKKLATDEHPRVRLEAVRAATFFEEPEAYEVLLIASDYPSDYYLDYVKGEASKTLEPLIKSARESGRQLDFTTEAGSRYLLRSESAERLLLLDRSQPVCTELLLRPGLPEGHRRQGLQDLAKIHGKSEAVVLLDTIRSIDSKPATMHEGVLFDLVRLLTQRDPGELNSVRGEIEALALQAKQPLIRQIAFVSLINVDAAVEKAWSLASRSDESLRDLLTAMPMISDPALRAALYPMVEPLLNTTGEVRQEAMIGMTTVRGQEAHTFEALSGFLDREEDRAIAIDALRRLPLSAWPKDRAGALADQMIDYLSKLSPADRTSEPALAALEFGNSLTTLLPAEQAKSRRQKLNELGVRIVRVGTLFERMAYDREVLVVEAGKPVEFFFENSDLMPHNFVITQPGAMEEIGLLAESTALKRDAAARQYVPKSDKILLSSKLLMPRATQKLPFTAPTTPGVYPYVCTYPGHWRRMYGALYVVASLDDYFANPDSYLASSALPIVDALLKDRRPRTEWKLSDLVAAVAEHGSQGRSYATGKQVFVTANCSGCHKLEDVGRQFGPELTKLDPKWQPTDVLAHIIDPSKKVDDKYKTSVFQMDDGAVITGMITEESEQEIKVIENPLAKAEPAVIKRDEITGRQAQNVSPMPKGLLDKLTRDEILDLLAYVVAGGDKQSKAFGAGHQHDHGQAHDRGNAHEHKH